MSSTPSQSEHRNTKTSNTKLRLQRSLALRRRCAQGLNHAHGDEPRRHFVVHSLETQRPRAFRWGSNNASHSRTARPRRHYHLVVNRHPRSRTTGECLRTMAYTTSIPPRPGARHAEHRNRFGPGAHPSTLIGEAAMPTHHNLEFARRASESGAVWSKHNSPPHMRPRL